MLNPESPLRHLMILLETVCSGGQDESRKGGKDKIRY